MAALPSDQEREHPGRLPYVRPASAEAARRRGDGSKVTAEQIAAIERMRRVRTPIAAIARATGLSRPTVYSVK